MMVLYTTYRGFTVPLRDGGFAGRARAAEGTRDRWLADYALLNGIGVNASWCVWLVPGTEEQ